MAVGQQVLSPTCDVGALRAASDRVEASTTLRSAAHAEQLRGVLAVDRVFADADMTLSAIAQVALLLRLSESAAHSLLDQARLLGSLDGAFEALEIGLWTVELSRAFCAEIEDRDADLQARVWAQLQTRLLADVTAGVVMTRARLVEWLRRRVIAADPEDAAARRKAAQANTADVEYRRRDDGLADLFALGLSPLNARAVLSRIQARAGRFGAQDPRSAGQRRMEAFTDLLLGRDSLPLGPVDDEDPFHQVEQHCGPSCGCRLGEPVPCGLGVMLQVPIGAALRTTDELADLEGHGPIDPDLLAAALANGPVIRAVHVDADGVPVAIGTRTITPAKRDPVGLRRALLDLAGGPPGPLHPRHPDEHRPDQHPPDEHPPDEHPPGGPAPEALQQTSAAVHDPPEGLRSRAHPKGTPGAYRPGVWLQRLLRARSPRCEWPACGAAAARCDLDHDLAWPAGPTCACNLGPLCRRHHRCKQQLMSKQRTPLGVVWTDPTGRRWLAPTQHQVPQPAVRPMPLLVLVDPDHDHPDDEDGSTDLDPVRLELRATDPIDLTPEQVEDLERAADRRWVERLLHHGWGPDLDDPTRWEPSPDPTEPPDDAEPHVPPSPTADTRSPRKNLPSLRP